jgi:UDP-glucose 4-epimerase
MARLLSQCGYRVTGIGHGDWTREEWESWGLSTWQWADVSMDSLREYAGEPDLIVDCAGSGSVSLSIEQPLLDFERTVISTAHLLEYVRTHAPACRVVYPSSASVYGTATTVPIRESSVAAPISQYGTHKWMAEQMVGSYANQFGTRTAIVRLFSVYGAGLRKQLLWDACRKFRGGDNVFMGTGEEVRDWLHVEDAVRLLAAAAEHASSACPTVNGGSGDGVAVRETLHQLGQSLPGQPVPVFSGAVRKGDPGRYIADIAGATAWGWKPERSWRSGVAEYAAWWLESSR